MMSALSHLRSFSHASCDALLQQRHIEVINAYNPNKVGWGRDSVYAGFFWAVGWLLLVATQIPGTWRRKDSYSRLLRFVLPCALAFGSGLLFIQLEGMTNYSDVCRHLLKLSSEAVPGRPMSSSPVALILVLCFIGILVSAVVFLYRRDTTRD